MLSARSRVKYQTILENYPTVIKVSKDVRAKPPDYLTLGKCHNAGTYLSPQVRGQIPDYFSLENYPTVMKVSNVHYKDVRSKGPHYLTSGKCRNARTYLSARSRVNITVYFQKLPDNYEVVTSILTKDAKAEGPGYFCAQFPVLLFLISSLVHALTLAS